MLEASGPAGETKILEDYPNLSPEDIKGSRRTPLRRSTPASSRCSEHPTQLEDGDGIVRSNQR